MAALASALDWQAAEGYRRAALAIPPRGKTGFTDMRGAQTGIQFSNVLSEARALTNQIYLNGSGVAAGDVDGDERKISLVAGLGCFDQRDHDVPGGVEKGRMKLIARGGASFGRKPGA